MKLNRKNLVVRVAFFGSSLAPNETTLCELFWLFVLKTVIGFVVLSLLGVFVSIGYVVLLVDGWLTFLAPFIVLALVITGIALVAGSVELAQKAGRTEVIAAVKRRFCPIVRID